MTNAPERDDSQISLRIAILSAFVTAVFFVALSIFQNLLPNGHYSGIIEVFVKSLAVIVAISFAHVRVEEARTIQNPLHIPFLSTFFFYGITLLLVYFGQICYIVFYLGSQSDIHFMQEVEFLFGIREFSATDISSAFFAGLVPYLVYYFFLRFRITRLMRAQASN